MEFVKGVISLPSSPKRTLMRLLHSKYRLPFLFLFLFPLTSRSQSSLGNNNSAFIGNNKAACITNAGKLLDEVFQLMERNYYRRDAVIWDTLQQAARNRLEASINCEAAYEVINWCFAQMKERHSFVMPAIKAATYNNDTSFMRFTPDLSDLVGDIRYDRAGDSIAYLTLPWINSSDEAVCALMADSIQQVIADLDNGRIHTWVIDLRQNTGGNCWPMIAGIGPLLGEGVCGYFVRNNEKVPFSYQNGTAFQGKHPRCTLNKPAYTLRAAPKRIIVLTGSRTSSSGEIIALAFKGKEGVQLIGEPTAGLTTANATYQLSNNAMLVLSVCQEADRNGVICEGRIRPDIWIDRKLPLIWKELIVDQEFLQQLSL